MCKKVSNEIFPYKFKFTTSRLPMLDINFNGKVSMHSESNVGPEVRLALDHVPALLNGAISSSTDIHTVINKNTILSICIYIFTIIKGEYFLFDGRKEFLDKFRSCATVNT